MNRSTVFCRQRAIALFSVVQLVLSVTHQRTVNVGQLPISVNEQEHRILSATDDLSIFGLSSWRCLSRVSAP